MRCKRRPLQEWRATQEHIAGASTQACPCRRRARGASAVQQALARPGRQPGAGGACRNPLGLSVLNGEGPTPPARRRPPAPGARHPSGGSPRELWPPQPMGDPPEREGESSPGRRRRRGRLAQRSGFAPPQPPGTPIQNENVTAVVGGLGGLATSEEAEVWIHEHLVQWSLVACLQVYEKGEKDQKFEGLAFAVSAASTT